MRAKPTCFIAMAFGREDTDALYDNQILPVLKRNGIKPVIINRQQSNQDLNIQIIEQLLKCDFCIADLTYARQSVYYEAGFAERFVPVVYTVRRDHLADGQPDDLRVHFDLQMKPLVTWNTPEHRMFATRLERRLRASVLREWARKQKEQDKRQHAIERFCSLSQSERLSLARRRAIRGLKSLGFRKWRAPKHRHWAGYHYKYDQIMSGTVDGVFSGMIRAKSFQFVSVHAFPSATKSILAKLNGAYDRLGRFLDVGRDHLKKLNVHRDLLKKQDSICAHHLVISIRPIPTSRIEDVFTWLRPNPSARVYTGSYTYSPFSYDKRRQTIPFLSNWHFLGGIESEISLRGLLKEHIDNYIGKGPR